MSPVFDPDKPQEHHVKLQPKTEEQLNADRLQAGVEYDFEVRNAIDSMSKKGNDMIALELLVYTPTGKVREMKDWLVAAMEHKVRHFAFGTGMGDKYESGEYTAADCIGRQGKVILREEKQEGYQPRLVVADYIVSAKGAAKPAPNAAPKLPAAAAGADEPPF